MAEKVQSNTSLNSVESQTLLNLDLFERTNPVRQIRKKSKIFKRKLSVFCALHKPVGSNKYYHYFFIALILFSCIVVNVFDTMFTTYPIVMMAVLDLFLSCLLIIEFILRLWSSDCIYDYQGFRGKLKYLRAYAFLRTLDVMAIITFSVFIWVQTFEGWLGITLRLLHILQVFQLYRLVFPLLKLMINTVYLQFNQLYIAFIFATLILVLTAFCIYLSEYADKDIKEGKTIFDGFWFSFITLTTVGFGDIVPHTTMGKVLTCILAFCGICMFSLPANIFGTGLAIKLKEQENFSRYRTPAIKLIQTVWKCFATEVEARVTTVWNTYAKQNRLIGEHDKQCIKFILKVKYFKASRYFNSVIKPKYFGDESFQQMELLRRVQNIESNLMVLKELSLKLEKEFDSINEELDKILTDLDLL